MTNAIRDARFLLGLGCLLLASIFLGVLYADDLATVTGSVTDATNAVVPDARVLIANIDTGVKRSTKSNESGLYVLPSLPPGRYELHVDKSGFQSVVRQDITLNVATTVRINIELKVGQTADSVTVTGGNDLLQTAPSVGTVIDRTFVSNLPLNGRSFQSLLTLSPGVVSTRATESTPGQFSVNGQRTNANYFTVDGVSANFGVTADGAIPQTGAGSVPGFSVSGGTNNLVSVDALQEFKIQTSTFAPEYGRTPGGQISIVTRSGSNQFHATVFDYFRNDALDSKDWFANANRLNKPALRQNDFGGVLGGPVVRNRTFFFFSYEGLRLRQPLTAITQVPTIASRNAAIDAIKPFLNAFPLPNGPGTTLGMAYFTSSYSNPTELNATSIRLDHTVNTKLSVFARYNTAPSNTVSRGLNGTLSQISPTNIDTRTLTAGATYSITPSIVNELRGNWSDVRGHEVNAMDSFGGAVPVPDASYYPSTFGGERNFTFSLTSATYQKGGFANNVQKQLNFIDGLSVVKGSHQMKFGVDFRRSIINYRPLQFNGQAIFQGATGALQGLIFSGAITATAGPKDVGTDNWSLYAQDIWKLDSRLTLTYGLRYELDTYPTEKLGRYPTPLNGLDNPATLSFAPAGTPLWHTKRDNFAPRVGLAYQLTGKPGSETILRGGFGLFYDLPYGSILGAFSNSWPSAVKRAVPAGTPFPYSATVATPPSLSAIPPATSIIAAAPDFRLPLTYQWNVTLERSLGTMQSISVAYIGAAGRRLLRQEQYLNPNPNVTTLFIARNDGNSDYDALQMQFTRRLSRRLQALVAYTWSHSIDNASNDASSFAPGSLVDPSVDRASSDFDIRHNIHAALTYAPHVRSAGRFLSALINNWSADTIFTARSSTPVNITTTTDVLGLGITSSARPDLVSGVPLYLNDPTVGGGQRFNRAAFSIPAANLKRQGTLGRNALRGFAVSQVDFAVRRQFNLTERLNLQFRAEMFNILNHPNFADPSGSLGTNGVPNTLFGISGSSLGQSLGSGGVSGGLNPLYQIGGPRSVQLSMKVQF